MNDNVEVIKSNKGGIKVIHRGYMYTIHKKRHGGRIRWRCTQRSLHCKGSISTGNGTTVINMPHNHVPDPHSVALARCKQAEEFPDLNSLLETQYDDVTDSATSQQTQMLPQLENQPIRPPSPPPTKNRPSETSSSSTSDEVCLRWNSHHSNIQTVFPQLLKRELYVDVTLVAEGKVLKCHKMILSSCSSYFEEILNGITPSQHPVVILRDVPYWVLKLLIEFMYVGEISIDQNKVPDLLEVAELLKVKGLARKSDKNETPKEQDAAAELKSPVHSQPAPSTDDLSSPPRLIIEQAKPLTAHTPPVKPKEKSPIKKVPSKKLKKRKSTEYEMPLPLFPMRRGTRSRPNVKIPKYYDYDDVIKPLVIDEGPPSPTPIKTEPIDVVENDISFNEESREGSGLPSVGNKDNRGIIESSINLGRLNTLQKGMDITPIGNNPPVTYTIKILSNLYDEGNSLRGDTCVESDTGLKDVGLHGKGRGETSKNDREQALVSPIHIIIDGESENNVQSAHRDGNNDDDDDDDEGMN